MKTLVGCIVGILFIFVSYLGLSIFEKGLYDSITDDKESVKIDLLEIDYSRLVSDVATISEDTKIPVLTPLVSLKNNQYDSLIFTTSFNKNFLNVPINRDDRLSGEVLISSKAIADWRIKISTFNSGHITFVPFSELRSYQTAELALFVPASEHQLFCEELESYGYRTIESQNIVMSSFFLSRHDVEIILFLSLLLLMALTVYFSGRSKRFGIYRLEGHSLFSIALLEAKRILPLCAFSISLALAICLIVITLNNPYVLISYLIFIAPFYLATVALIFVLYSISSLIAIGGTSYQKIKGQSKLRGIYYASLCFKCFASALLVIASVSLLLSLKDTAQIIESKTKAIEALQDYATLHIEGVYDDNIMDFVPNFQELFQVLDNERNVVIITPESVYFDPDDSSDPLNNTSVIDVNENYLNVNPLFDSNNKRIDLAAYASDLLVVLAPESAKESQSELTEYILKVQNDNHNLIKEKIKIIWYKEGQKVITFSPDAIPTGPEASGDVAFSSSDVLTDPFLFVYNENYYSADFFADVFLADSVYIEVVEENPYNELRPAIETAGLERVVAQASPVSVFYDDMLQSMRANQVYNSAELAVYALVVLLCLFYVCSVFFETNRRPLSIRLINGYSFVINARKHFIALLVTFIAGWLVFIMPDMPENYRNFTKGSFAVISIAELLIVFVFIRSMIIKGCASFLKGK
ncbi:MAG: hypothetical protein FWG00_05020 [Coriobacteriia bacterium]|nr:hypothetical protein [Coriobacteriia bacterium]